MAMIECDQTGYEPILQVHDELIFETKDKFDLPDIKELMEEVMLISVPIEVDIHIGDSWAEAKK